MSSRQSERRRKSGSRHVSGLPDRHAQRTVINFLLLEGSDIVLSAGFKTAFYLAVPTIATVADLKENG
jgi:hypothetical protein